MLFKPNDRRETVTAFRAEFDPYYSSRFIRFQTTRTLTKRDILDNCNADMTEFAYEGEQSFRMTWIYNMIPTEIEWDKFEDNDKFILTFRICTLLSGSGKVAIIQPIGLPALRWSVSRPRDTQEV